jgi:superfamily I DNA/RNA helicase
LAYLRDVFTQFLKLIEFDVETCATLKQAYEGFFETAEEHLSRNDQALPRDSASFRKLFSHPSGVVINTCHGVKGEEYHTVIAFGLLKGFVPHWDAIIDQPQEVAADQESKLLYVICSRAKQRLHLISESGRVTGKNNAYSTADLLRTIEWEYD